MEKIGICALCKEKKKFMRAHVISKALFKSIFREYGKVHYVNVADLETPNKVQDAFFDNALYCIECDNTFSPYEQYFADLIRGRLAEIGVTANLKLLCPPNYNIDVHQDVDPILCL
ncbi:hypothetical protein [Sphingobacterium ginsenosidimutans]|uniref:Uncharacterized protein n=1 Tax=Sphingobacterium ginsenosidimutans TaxID=687845 RepID=A0ABP8AA49_9SPHI